LSSTAVSQIYCIFKYLRKNYQQMRGYTNGIPASKWYIRSFQTLFVSLRLLLDELASVYRPYLAGSLNINRPFQPLDWYDHWSCYQSTHQIHELTYLQKHTKNFLIINMMLIAKNNNNNMIFRIDFGAWPNWAKYF
jgi:hypothetical protein